VKLFALEDVVDKYPKLVQEEEEAEEEAAEEEAEEIVEEEAAEETVEAEDEAVAEDEVEIAPSWQMESISPMSRDHLMMTNGMLLRARIDDISKPNANRNALVLMQALPIERSVPRLPDNKKVPLKNLLPITMAELAVLPASDAMHTLDGAE
jgi:hypothetical protein